MATGRRRLAAFLIDLIFVGLLSSLDWRILGVLLGFFFFRIATRGATTGIGRAFRGAVGCLGGVILFTTFMVTTGFLGDLLFDRDDPPPVAANAGTGTVGASDVLEGLVGFAALGGMDDPAEWEATAFSLGATMLEASDDVDVDGVLETLELRLPDSMEEDEQEAILARLEVRFDSVMAGDAALPPAAESEAMTLAEAFAILGESSLATATDSSEAAEEEARAREARRERARLTVLQSVGGDSLEALAERARELEDEVDQQRDARRAAEEEAEEAGGLFSWFVGTLDELGLTFGWGALYFSTLLAWFGGTTIGKRILGMRVVRLDGEPVTLYIAFERSGGYAAGVATGLLGFAQVLWDANRQAIHDKIAGTVVIRTDVPEVPVAAARGSVEPANR